MSTLSEIIDTLDEGFEIIFSKDKDVYIIMITKFSGPKIKSNRRMIDLESFLKMKISPDQRIGWEIKKCREDLLKLSIP